MADAFLVALSASCPLLPDRVILPYPLDPLQIVISALVLWITRGRLIFWSLRTQAIGQSELADRY